MTINSRTGEVVVKESGSYFVFSQVTFKSQHGGGPQQGVYHRLVKNHRDESKGGKKILLSATQGPASYLQGFFRLIENDTLAVDAPADELNKDNNGKLIYFGAYLVRTEEL
nr:hypothetical protein BaRGS_002098 [Batillaria attramentaria]